MGKFTRRGFSKVLSCGIAGSLCPSAFLEKAYASGVFDAKDSLGRGVEIPQTIGSVVPLGVHSQTLLTTLCPDRLASLAVGIKDEVTDYSAAGLEYLANLPETGKWSMRDGDAFAETVMECSPDLLIDAGLPRDGLSEDLDWLHRRTGIPVFFLDISFGMLPDAYETLGALLQCAERSAMLANCVRHVLAQVESVMSDVDAPVRVFYAPRTSGLMLNRGVGVQLEAISHVGAIPIVNPYDYEGGGIDLAELCNEPVDVVVFDDLAISDYLLSQNDSLDPCWRDVLVTAGGTFVVSPALFHSWFGSMVLVQSLGVLWLASMLVPTLFQQKVVGEIGTLYKAFYGIEIGDDCINALIGR